ncbi:MAG: hypothetical protein ACR2KJ_14590 [Jatrophihabitans sp.]
MSEEPDPQLHIVDVTTPAATTPDDLGADVIAVDPHPSRLARYTRRTARSLGPVRIATALMLMAAAVVTGSAVTADRPVHTTQHVIRPPKVEVDALGCPLTGSCLVRTAEDSSVVQAMARAAPGSTISDPVATYDTHTNRVYRVSLVATSGKATFQIVSQCIPGTAPAAAQTTQSHEIVKHGQTYSQVDTVLTRQPDCSVYITGDGPELTYTISGSTTFRVLPTGGTGSVEAFPIPLDTFVESTVRALTTDPGIWLD